MLEIAVASLYFVNKVLLSLDKKAGWQIGLLASITAIFYFFSIKLYLLVGLEVGFFVILIFGLINHDKPLKGEKYLYFNMILLLVLLFFILKNSTLIEFFISTAFILAIYFLAKKQWQIGWFCMLIGHVVMCYFTFQKGQYFFPIMQGCSVFVSVFALFKNRKIH
jgi:hypothetical protein